MATMRFAAPKESPITDHIKKLKPLASSFPRQKLNFTLDPEEKSIISRANELSKEEIWDLLEEKRAQDFKRTGITISADCLGKARCPLCTLMPPCKHYTNGEEIMQDAYKVVNQPEYKKALPVAKREKLIRDLKRQLNQELPRFNQDASHQFLDQPSLQYNESQDSIEVPHGMGKRSASIAPHMRNSAGSPKHSNYLKRGKGSGGSPTQFEVMEDQNS